MTLWPLRLQHWPLYAGLLVIAALAGVFGIIADEMSEGDTTAFDTAVLMWFRDPADPANPLGPPWLEEAIRDITSLGSFSILALILILVVVALAMSSRRGTALFVAGSVIGGEILSTIFKATFNRTRPDFIDPERVLSASFPSGHAALSAVVYLTLGTILAGSTEKTSLRIFYIGTAVFLTLIVGLSRLYLGVHFPTDVLAGWALGIAWALFAGVAYRIWEIAHPQKPL
ncbi:MAG TPA: phosphatase PAP2 family protein [Devosia sp.]|nr:phosphatase PAP2 family protein [Devosia sp.]